MKIKEMFRDDIDRTINGVVQVEQEKEDVIKQEVNEYVVTKELKKHFTKFFNEYGESFHTPTDNVGVWITGFFGSGKSHFLKMLSYLLENKKIGNKNTVDYFEEKFDDEATFMNVRIATQVPTETILFNIDSEEEGVFLVSCAGGANTHIDFKIETEPLKGQALSIKVDGLLGGHSGMEIIKQRANAIKLLGRILSAVKAEQSVHIVSISGGSKHNAIAKEAQAIITVEDAARAQTAIAKLAEAIKAEYRVADKDIRIIAESATALPKMMYNGTVSSGIIDFMTMVPDGVQYMSMDIPGLVQTSLNNGILALDGETLQFTISVRS